MLRFQKFIVRSNTNLTFDTTQLHSAKAKLFAQADYLDKERSRNIYEFSANRRPLFGRFLSNYSTVQKVRINNSFCRDMNLYRYYSTSSFDLKTQLLNSTSRIGYPKLAAAIRWSSTKPPSDNNDNQKDKPESENKDRKSEAKSKVKSSPKSDYVVVESAPPPEHNLSNNSLSNFQKIDDIIAELNYEQIYKDDKKFHPVIECPNCGAAGSRINPKINSPFFTCPKCKTAYMSRTPVVLNVEDSQGVGINDSDNYRKQKEKKAIEDYIEKNKNDLPPSPRLINEYLNQYIVGQESARRILSVAIYNHYKRIKQNFFNDISKNGLQDETANQSNNPQHQRIRIGDMSPGGQIKIETMNQMKGQTYKSPFQKIEKEEKAPADVEEKLKQSFSHISAISGAKLKEKLDLDIKMAKIRQTESGSGEILLEKSNVIMAGPTGTGKTYIAKTLAQALGVPIAVADATTLTSAGYVGDDADTIIKKLLDAADGDVKRAETGIVFIDEIDKIAISTGMGNTKDIGGEGVQQALLKIIGGTKVSIKNKKQPMTLQDMQNADKVVDTTNILFIGSGAFVGLEKTIANRIKKRQIGFRTKSAGPAPATTSQIEQPEKPKVTPTTTGSAGPSGSDKYQQIVRKSNERDELLEKMTADDLQKFGLIPEFIGRMPIRTALKGLTEQDLIKILVEPKNAIVPQFKALFRLDNVELVINDEALLEIARMALVQQTGARGLRSILENLLLDAMYNAPDSNIIKVEVTAEAVRDGAPLKYTYEAEEEDEPVYSPPEALSASVAI